MPRNAVGGLAWSASVATVAEYVLSRRASAQGESARTLDRVAQISAATGISYGQVAKVLVMFDGEGYTVKSGPERGPNASREYRDVSSLLSEWGAHYARISRHVRTLSLHVPSREANEWVATVAHQLGSVPWAVSGWTAADAVAPFATHVPDLTVYVPQAQFDDAADRIVKSSDVTPVQQGARIHLRAAEQFVFEFCASHGGTPLVSPVRVYADLLTAAGRGSEAADHLREVALDF